MYSLCDWCVLLKLGSHFKEIAERNREEQGEVKTYHVWHVNVGSESSKGTLPEAYVG